MSVRSLPEDGDALLWAIKEILEAMTQEWDRETGEEITGETRLIKDLGFESIDVVQFIVAIEERFGRRGLPYEEFLMVDGRYVDEIHVKDVVDFLRKHLYT